jgi:hypothetical protein
LELTEPRDLPLFPLADLLSVEWVRVINA